MVRFISFSDRDFRYVSLALLKATIVAASYVDRLMRGCARSLGKGARLTRVAGFMTLKGMPYLEYIQSSDRGWSWNTEAGTQSPEQR